MTKPIIVKLVLPLKAKEELEAYTDHLNVSLNWLVRKLVLEELVNQRVLYKQTDD